MLSIRPLTINEVLFTITALPEEREPDFPDEQDNDDINSQLLLGNEWAWCIVEVKAIWNDLKASAHLGGCSYKSETDFINDSGMLDELKAEALDCLNNITIANYFNKIKGLIFDLSATEINSLIAKLDL